MTKASSNRLYSKQLYEFFVNAINEGIVATTKEGTIEFANDFFAHLVELPVSEIIGSSIYLYLPKAAYEQFSAISHCGQNSIEREFILVGKSDATKTICCRISSLKLSPKKTKICYFIQDITETKIKEDALNQKIDYMTHHDSLTGLYNRRAFQEKLTQLISFVTRNFALVKAEIDNPASIISAIGHEDTNLLLKDLANRMEEKFPNHDHFFAKLGEFRFGLIFIYDKDAISMISKVKALSTLFKESFSIHEQQIYISASIGVSLFPHDSREVRALLEHAESGFPLILTVSMKLSRFYEMLY